MGAIFRSSGAIGLAVLIAACATVPAAPPPPAPPSLDAIEARLAHDIEILASDGFGGRFPGSPGEAKTIAFLTGRFAEIGLQPAVGVQEGEGDWTQEFTLVRRTPNREDGSTRAMIMRGPRSIALSQGLVGVHPGIDRADFADLPMVGVDPALDTLKPRSMINRALVLPVSAWSARASQIEAAQPRIVVLTSKDAEEFETATGLLERGRWRLESDTDSTGLILLSPADSAKLTALVGRNAQRHPDGLGVIAYDTILAGSIAQTVERIETANIVGRAPGAVEGAGTVLMLAHWDHLGDECAPPEAIDRICNGAVDNASGVAVMTEAVRLALADGPLDRDLVVLATSAEELGLLGAEAFARDPTVPLPTIVAAFNIDTIAIAPRGTAVSVIGWGRTALDPGIGAVVEEQGRTLALADWHQSFLRRQDGWAFLSRDVPTVLVGSAAADADAFNAFMSGNYHGPADEFGPDLELGGAAQDVLLHAALLRHFGSLTRYPGGGR